MNSEEDTSRQETHTNTLQRDVGAREEQEALEQSSRESAPETQRFMPLQVVDVDE